MGGVVLAVRSSKDKELTAAAAAGGGEDTPRQVRGFWLASVVIRSMMLLVGVIVAGIRWSTLQLVK